MKKLISILLFVSSFIRPHPAFAAMTMSFSGLPSTINQDEEFTIQTSLAGASTNTTYYLRAAFYTDATTQYFGYTYNNQGAWNNSPSNYTQFYQINTGSTGTFSGPIKVKVDLLSTYFKGSGEYQFKLGRYTEAGSGPTWSDASVTTIIGPTPTPTPIPPTATPTLQPTSAPEPSSTPAPTIAQAPTNTPTPRPTATLTLTPTPVDGDILGESAIENEVPTKPPEIPAANPERNETKKKNNQNMIPTILIIVGILLMTGSTIPLLIQKAKVLVQSRKPPV